MYQSYKEIFYQDESLRKTFDYVLSQQNDIYKFFSQNKADEVVFVGCGSSYWLSLSSAMTFQEKTGIRSCAVTSGDIVMNKDYYSNAYKNPLIIAPSRSGNTTETLQALDFLKKTYGCKVLAVVEYENSQMLSAADMTLQIPWANEISVCQTRSFSNLYLATVMLGAIVGEDKGLLDDLDRYIGEARQLMERDEKVIRNIIDEFKNWRNLVTLGNGKQYGVACEGAYICIEMAQFSSNYYPTLELRHGPIVMLDGTSIAVFFCGGNARDLDEGMAKDALNKGAKVIAICAKNDFKNAQHCFNLGREAYPETVALYGIFIMQGVAHLKAVNLGIDPDNPKGLVPWIKI